MARRRGYLRSGHRRAHALRRRGDAALRPAWISRASSALSTRISDGNTAHTTGRTVALIVRPWAVRPSAVWRDATSAARDAGAEWCCVFAPPTLSIIPATGHATAEPGHDPAGDAGPRSIATFLSLTHAASFDNDTLERWLHSAASEQARMPTSSTAS